MREIAFELGGDHLSLLSPEMLWLLAITPLFLWVMLRSLADLPPLQRWLSLAVRVLLVGVLALGLARVARTTDSSRVSTIYLVDVSDSVSDAALEEARSLVDAAVATRGDNDLKLVTFAREARSVPIEEGTSRAPTLERHRPAEAGAGTDIEAALELAYGLFAPGHLRRIVLISDGRETEGDLLAEASHARDLRARILHRSPRESAPKEVAIRELTVPDRIEVGEPFFVRARIYSTTRGRARVRLYQGETINGLDGIRDLELEAGDNELELRSVVRVAGSVTYSLELTPTFPDRFTANNRFAVTAVVPGKPAVLLVEGDPARATYLARALTASQYEVEVRGPREVPQSVRELERFDFFILSDTPAENLSLSQMDAIERYVRDLGGGFLMAGGDGSFGLGGYQRTRMEQLLPVRMDAERRRDQPSLALALVIDKSGSMSGTKIELAKEAAKATAELLGPDDYIGVIGFDSEPTRVVRMQSARNRLQILTDIGRLTAAGGTNIFPALDAAYQDLLVTRARIKHVILLTDGQAPEEGIATLVQAMRADAITVSIVGLGADVNRGFLQSVANLGGGRAYFTLDPHNIPRIFTRETATVSRSSAVEEFFQPTLVSRADFLRGIDLAGAPFLHGYVATQAKPEPAQVILESDTGEPILARWRVGLGWSLAWTSDIKNRWAVEWLRWPGFGPFWSQLVREHMRQRRRQTLDMRAEVEGDAVRVSVDALDGEDRFMNDLQSSVTITGPLGGRRGGAPDANGDGDGDSDSDSDALIRQEHVLQQIAPGRYEARFPLHRYGSFVLNAVHRREGRVVAESHAALPNPYPREYADIEPNEALLARAASLTGGKKLEKATEAFDPRGEKIRAHEELWPRLVWVAIGLFLLDLLLRRVRLFDRDFKKARARAQ